MIISEAYRLSCLSMVENGEMADYETHRGQTNYYAGSSRIAMKTDQGKYIWLHGDHLGSTNVTADRHGNELSRTKYHAWGTTWSSTSQTQTDYAYTGHTLTPKAGSGTYGLQVDDIYYYNARWPEVPEAQRVGFDPTIDRFMQANTLVPGQHDILQQATRYHYSKWLVIWH